MPRYTKSGQKKNTRSGKEIPGALLFLILMFYRNAWPATGIQLFINHTFNKYNCRRVIKGGS